MPSFTRFKTAELREIFQGLERLYAWRFEKGGREIRVRVQGQLVFNTTTLAVKAAVAGAGLAFVPEDRVTPHIKE
jgi:DNA-binding transcriptional LysR family regulator